MNPTWKSERARRYYEKHRDEIVASAREKRKRNPERQREYTRRHYLKYKEQIKVYRDGRKEITKEYDRWHRLEKKFGLTKEQYQEMWNRQNGKCPICLIPLPSSPHVDHDHETNRIRGLTCGPCNRFVLAKPDIEKFKRAIEYLKTHL